MKRLKESAMLAIMLLIVSLFTGCGMLYSTSGSFTNYENPSWGPDYYNGARYYYLPDIESYYDLSTHDFAYLDNGQWTYSQSIPPMYSDFDLNNCYVVVLNTNVFQPWLHHQYYVSHYPRYYYVDYYDHSNIPYVRGFNENVQSAIYWKDNERSKARSWDNQNPNNNRQFSYSKADRRQQKNQNNQTINRQPTNNTINKTNATRAIDNKTIDNTNATRNSGSNTVSNRPQNTPVVNNTPPVVNNSTRQQPVNNAKADKTQPTNYYGRTIGKPVKVTNQMRNQNGKGNRTTAKRR
jgi:hypothetical protein